MFQPGAVYPQPNPTAPPVYGNVPGYEGFMAGGAGGFVPPPAPLHPLPTPDTQPSQVDWNIPSISEDAAQTAFLEYASENCCYSKAPAKDGVITNMESFNTYRYRLETFTEARITEWKTEPFTDQAVDFGLQTAPTPWAIQVQTPALFKDHEENIKVPNTSSVKDCHICKETGQTRCDVCTGSGKKNCSACDGSGKRFQDTCDSCGGSGKENCTECNGDGLQQCETCEGRKQLLMFINLKITWKNNLEDYVAQQSSGIQIENLSSVTGNRLFHDAQYMVYPVYGFPDPNVSQASDRLVKEHQSKFSQSGRIHQQQHTIELIPITKVSYKWKGDSHLYYVFGNESKVSTDYPATCCCVVM
ncbi:protein SSUH2 homolog isoform X2 [Clupea harengus]|uniref:Protein SSUH2 homolog isoform X2 n=1 Tax=Clupea harengus TaxID=7950 RepID=A0A6P8F6H5_CLUHA|nr:protein SSUH2 homolog isoform X2 [Clupea harengus]